MVERLLKFASVQHPVAVVDRKEEQAMVKCRALFELAGETNERTKGLVTRDRGNARSLRV